MDNLKTWGVRYISHREVKENDAVMFDIDDTLIFTDGRPNTPIIELLHEALRMGYKIVIITARPGLTPVINWTIHQLGEYGIRFHYIGFTSAKTKTVMKKQLPYKFILSVGDLPTDLTDSNHFLNISNFYHN
jgi:hydroxymethylpyrimidine pyrophosphatase-like HAD family hydrolase